MKKVIFILIISILFVSSVTPVYSDNTTIQVKVNNMSLTFDVEPISIKGRVLVPLRTIFEKLSMTVTWDGPSKAITGTKEGLTVKLQQDSNLAYINNNQVTLDVPAQAVTGRILVPVRFIAESTGAKVFWDGKGSTVYISTSTDKALTLDKIISSAENSNEGLEHSNAGNYELALKSYDKAIEIDPYNYSAYYWKGLDLKEQKKYEESIKCFDQAISINPKSNAIHEEKAWLLFSLERYKDAAKSYEDAVKYGKDQYYAKTFNDLGDKLYFDNNYEDSILFYNIVINYFPNDADFAYYSKAAALHYQFKYEEALQNYDKAIAINPKYYEAYNNKGNVYKDLGNLNEALKCYDKAIELNPDNYEAFYSKGNALYQFEKYEDAITVLDKVVSMTSLDIEAYEKIILSLYKLDRDAEAIDVCATAIYIHDDSALFYNLMGNLYYWNDMIYEALEMYDQAIMFLDINESLFVFSNKGNTLYKMRRYEEALIAYDKAIELNLVDEYVYNSKGNTLFELKRYEEAILAYNKSLEINDKYATAYFNKAICCMMLNNIDESLANLKKAIELDESIKETVLKYTIFDTLKTNPVFIQLMDKVLNNHN